MHVRRAFIPDAAGLMVRVAHPGGQIALTNIDGRPFPLGILLRKDVVPVLVRAKVCGKRPEVICVLNAASAGPVAC